MRKGTTVRPSAAAIVVAIAVVAMSGDGLASDVDPAATSAPASTGVVRTPLGQAEAVNAPGQVLYLQKVTIAPKAKLSEHFHQGTQIARVVSGVLTYNVVSGIAAITRADGRTQVATGPKVLKLRRNDTIVETASLVHFGANDTGKPVVIELAALLQEGAPVATAVGANAPGTAIRLTTNLDSQSRTLLTAGTADAVVYGWNRLTGTATLDGQTVGVEMLGSVDYTRGSGPFFAFITFSFADGSTLATATQGITQASADTTSATFAATMGVIAGTGRYVSATGAGTFTGSRSAALGTSVAAIFELQVEGAQ